VTLREEGGAADLVLYLARRPSLAVRREVGAIASSLPAGWQVAIVSYRDQGPAADRRTLVGLRSVPWHVYDRASIHTLPYPGKLRPQTEQGWAIIPGNVDLVVLRHWQRFPGHRRIWLIEDDVRYSGDWGELFRRLDTMEGDLLMTCPRTFESEPDWTWWNSLKDPSGRVVRGPPGVSGFFPFFRIGAAALAALDAAYREGWAGHYEVAWPMLLLRAGLSVVDLGGPEAHGPGPVPGALYHHRTTFRYRPAMEAPGDLPGMLWHPVKPPSRRSRAARALKSAIGIGAGGR
jgi:hypothetical protein